MYYFFNKEIKRAKIRNGNVGINTTKNDIIPDVILLDANSISINKKNIKRIIATLILLLSVLEFLNFVLSITQLCF